MVRHEEGGAEGADPLPDSLRTLAEIDPALAEKLRQALES